jgi:alpha-glucosidase
MMIKQSILFILLFLVQQSVFSSPVDLLSPDSSVKISVDLSDKIYYTVRYKGDVLLDNNSLQLKLSNETLGANPKLVSQKTSTIDETIDRPIALRNAKVQNNCRVLLLNFKGDYSVEFRAYNDGVAYRFITKKKADQIEVLSEEAMMKLPSEYDVVWSPARSFKTSYEIPYKKVTTTAIKDMEKSTLPVLLDTRKGVKMLVTEADLFDYPCMFLKGMEGQTLQATFPLCPLEFGPDGDRSVKILKEAPYIAKTKGSRSFPWRVVMISHDDRQIFENELVFKLSRPNEIGATDWIKPGQVSWEWWHDARLYNVDFKSGYNLDSYKYYIDFASKFGIPYIIMDEGWAKDTRDPFTPNPTIDLFELIKYGQSKNVKIVLWLTWLTVENNFNLFKTFSDWGIAGVKIDFMDRSDQWMVKYYERVAREAAKNHLFVDFHGAFKPAGMEKALPNILSHEGVVGMEQNIGGGLATPNNNAWLPFMRNAVGPMDFTPGAMNSVHPEDYKSTRTNPQSIGTRAYQLALFVVFESGLQMLADNPYYYYRERECTDFITSVPVTWDETKVLAAEAGEYIVVVKRKGDQWFFGGMTNSKKRSVELSFDFLPQGKEFTLTSFEDGINADRQALDYKKKTIKVSSNTKMTVNMERDGGWAASLK